MLPAFPVPGDSIVNTDTNPQSTQFSFPDMSHDERWVSAGRDVHVFRGSGAWEVCHGLSTLFRFSSDDKVMKKVCMAYLSQEKLAKDVEIGEAFGCCRQTVAQARKQFLREGVEGLVPKGTGPKGPRTPRGLERKIVQLRHEELSYRAIARETGVSATQVRDVCKRNGLVPATPETELPLDRPSQSTDEEHQEPVESKHDPEREARESEEALRSEVETHPHRESLERRAREEASSEQSSADADPTGESGELEADSEFNIPVKLQEVAAGEPAPTRGVERLLVRFGKLGKPEVDPEFVSGSEVPGAGTLLAFALVTQDGCLQVARQVYGRLSNGFYGLRSVVLTLLAAAMLGVRTLDRLQHGRPHHWGRLLGLDRLPETKTVRRKFSEIAREKNGDEFMRQMAKRRLQANKDLRALLYVDGHVRAYYGKRRLGKRHMNRLNQSQKAVMDYWAHDGAGAPLLKICGAMDSSLVRIIREIVAEVRPWIDEQTPLIIVFDREGWSPQLFHEFRHDNVWIITYRKGKKAAYPEREFDQIVHFPKEPGKPEKTYQVRDRRVRIGAHFFRSVTVLRADGQQTEIISTDFKSSTEQILREMFSRWGGENDFKYRRTHGNLDRLGSYQFEPVPDEVRVRNPEHTKLDRQVKDAEARRKNLLVECANKGKEKLSSEERKEKRKEIGELEKEIKAFKEQRYKIGKYLKAGDLPEDQRPEQPSRERKLFSDVVSISADHIERRLHGMLARHYKSSYKDGRELLRQIYTTTGDFHFDGQALHVTLNALASPHQTRALAGLCEEVNGMNPTFPESKIALRFSVHPHPGQEEMVN